MRIRIDKKKVLDVFGKLKENPAFSESAKLVEKGRLPVEMLQAMSLRQPILKVLAVFGEGVYPGGLLPRRLKELVILQASMINSCQFCTDSHISMIRQLQIAVKPVDLLKDSNNLNEREKLALKYTKEAMKNSNKITDIFFDKLRKSFSDEEIVELTAVIGMINMLNLFNNCLQITYRGEYEVGKLK